MASNGKSKSESRRIEAKRKRSEHRESVRRGVLRELHPGVLLTWAAFFVASVFLILPGQSRMAWRLNETTKQDITARVDFSVPDERGYNNALQHQVDAVPNVFFFAAKPVIDEIGSRSRELLRLARNANDDIAQLKADVADAERGWTLDDPAATALLNFALKDEAAFNAQADRVADLVKNEYIVKEIDNPARTERPANTNLRGVDGIDRTVPTSQLVLVSDEDAIKKIAARIVAVEEIPVALKSLWQRVIVSSIIDRRSADKEVKRPLWKLDDQATEQAIANAKARVHRDDYRITKKKGDLLVRAGSNLSATDLELLQFEHEAYREAQTIDPNLKKQKLLAQSGTVALLLLIVTGLATYTAIYQPRIFDKPARSFALAGLMLLMVGLNEMIGLVQRIELFPYPVDAPGVFSVACIVTAASLLTIAYDQRFAFGACGALAILITVAGGNEFGLFVTLVVAMGATVFLLREVRTRSKVISVGLVAGILAGLTSLSADLMAQQELPFALFRACAAGAAALFAGFFVQGILPQFERVFGIATSMTLLEWCDASKPLLRRLAQEAPGTYSHSLTLSHMVEEAAEAIGARGLLARVGALYHDVGKLNKSSYFVENQEARMNRHDKLSPTMSLLIIFGHVKDGVEMARAYNVPRILHRFISEHHGTTVVKYFHYAAAEASKKNTGKHDREVSESEFRYPGPKPHSKETAILMVCDTCEGAVRAQDDVTTGRIEAIVHQMVMDRLNDGQFDECDITLRELKLVESSVVKSLCAIHHGRIKYPKGSKRKDVEAGTSEDDKLGHPVTTDDAQAESMTANARTTEAARQA